MHFASRHVLLHVMILFVAFLFFLIPFVHISASNLNATFIATTTIRVSICGNSIVDDGEQCDIPGETGSYSTTIAGRQCNTQCNWGPYCGDGILETAYGEQCDDGNNNDGDFCSATCKIEPAGSGGGGTSGGGSSGGGGQNTPLGDTQVSVTGKGYPSQSVNILLDGKAVGTVRADSSGNFTFATNANPGTVSMGFWATDIKGNKSITYNTTFDVTQGAITSVNSVLLPPTLVADKTNINPGDTITFTGQTIPNTQVEIHIDDSATVLTGTSTSQGTYSIPYQTTGLSATTHTARARFILGGSGLSSDSSYSTTLQLFVGVAGKSSTPSDLNRDGSVNLIDFSILIFWWGTAGGDSNPPADINGDKTVGLADFSILLFNWTG